MHIPQAQQSHQQPTTQLSRSAPQTSPIHSHALNQHREQVLQQSHTTTNNNHHNNTNNTNNVNNNNTHHQIPPLSTTQTQAHIAPSPASPKMVQIQAPLPATSTSSGRASPNQTSPGQSQLGGGKWLANIKNIVNPKANSSLNVVQKKDIPSILRSNLYSRFSAKL